MRQLYILIKKELGGLFESNAAYAVMFSYVFASMGVAFYFGGYFNMQDSSLYSLFYIQPILLIILLPILTMKSWSDEYKSGTAEIILTQPVSDIKLVFSKVVSVFILFFLMIILTIPFVLYTGKWLHLDYQNIILNYFGVINVSLFLISFGCLISCFCNNTISAYILSIFFTGIWLLLPFSKFYPIYNNYLFAEIGLGDIFYFYCLTISCFFINVLLLKYKRYSGKNKLINLFLITFLVFTGSFALISSFYYLFPEKYDFTAAKIYTLKKETKEFLSYVSKPIKIDVYIAQDYQKHNAVYSYYMQRIERLLNKYSQETKGMINVSYNVVSPFSEMEKQVLQSGIYYKQNNMGSYDYFGAVLHDENGDRRVIKQFLNERMAFAEKDIDIALMHLVSSKLDKYIGVYLDSKQNIDYYEGFFLNLENDYYVNIVSENTYEISPKLDLLVLINPKTIPEHFKYAIDQYLMNGGKILLFIDVMTKRQDEDVNKESIDIVDMLDKWGIKIKDSFYDKGITDIRFNPLRKKINLYKAVSFDVDAKDKKIQPIIKNDENMIGVMVEGKFLSNYRENPYQKENFAEKMAKFISKSKNAKISVIGDVDIIDDDNWIDKKTEDKNPYSIISYAENGMVLRNIVDYMVGNEIYNLLPINIDYNNQRSISELLNLFIYMENADNLEKINQELFDMRIDIYEKGMSQADQIQKLLNVSSAGQKIAVLEKKLEAVQYNMKSDYSEKVNFIIFLHLFLIPIVSIFLIYIAFRLINRYKRKKIAEMFDEQ